MKKLSLEHAVGEILGHDITEVSPQQGRKGVAFRRGHVIQAQDLEVLQNLGKRHIYVWEGSEQEVHEDDAARILAPLIAGPNIRYDAEPREGKIGFYATCAGIFKVDVERLERINALSVPSLPTIHTNFPVKVDKQVAAFRIIPLSCTRKMLARIEVELKRPLVQIKPYVCKRASILVTGNEVFSGSIDDAFSPRLEKKLHYFGVEVCRTRILPDERAAICAAIRAAVADTGLVLLTGGTSVDPDDVTVEAMRDAGVDFPFQGNPIQPGNNLTIGYTSGATLCAVPAAALFYEYTALDIFLPRILAGEHIPVEDIVRSGHGGLCHFCSRCVYPVCPFGRGG
jgi:molybdenum cofactor synthesis domain-containing protein